MLASVCYGSHWGVGRCIRTRLSEVISEVVVGKPRAVELAVTCLLAEGHLLIQDVPGTGKTTLARAVAASLGAQWKRIQFTPDLLPADITGTTMLDQDSGGFKFHQGPVSPTS